MKVSSFHGLIAAVSLASVGVVAADDHCYTSTAAMLEAQATGVKELIICPNTTIDIGLPADDTFSSFTGGDFPLAVIDNGVTIKCGDDGKSTNNCVLNGGFAQFATSPMLAQVPGLMITTDNLLVQGLTFTGALTTLPGLDDRAISLSAPGQNMVFDDVVVENIKGLQIFTMAFNGLGDPALFPSGSASVTVKNSVFRQVTYGIDVVYNRNQTVILDNVVFEDVTYDPILAGNTSSEVIFASGGELQVLNTEFTNVGFNRAVVVIRGEDTKYTISGVTGSNWEVYDEAIHNETMFCADSAETMTSVSALTNAPSPMKALVLLASVLTLSTPPTAAAPAPPPEPATAMRLLLLSARTSTDWFVLADAS